MSSLRPVWQLSDRNEPSQRCLPSFHLVLLPLRKILHFAGVVPARSTWVHLNSSDIYWIWYLYLIYKASTLAYAEAWATRRDISPTMSLSNFFIPKRVRSGQKVILSWGQFTYRTNRGRLYLPAMAILCHIVLEGASARSVAGTTRSSSSIAIDFEFKAIPKPRQELALSTGASKNQQVESTRSMACSNRRSSARRRKRDKVNFVKLRPTVRHSNGWVRHLVKLSPECEVIFGFCFVCMLPWKVTKRKSKFSSLKRNCMQIKLMDVKLYIPCASFGHSNGHFARIWSDCCVFCQKRMHSTKHQ